MTLTDNQNGNIGDVMLQMIVVKIGDYWILYQTDSFKRMLNQAIRIIFISQVLFRY